MNDGSVVDAVATSLYDGEWNDGYPIGRNFGFQSFCNGDIYLGCFETSNDNDKPRVKMGFGSLFLPVKPKSETKSPKTSSPSNSPRNNTHNNIPSYISALTASLNVPMELCRRMENDDSRSGTEAYRRVQTIPLILPRLWSKTENEERRIPNFPLTSNDVLFADRINRSVPTDEENINESENVPKSSVPQKKVPNEMTTVPKYFCAYEGYWLDNLPHGRGVSLSPDGMYEGNFKGGNREGFGTLFLYPGSLTDCPEFEGDDRVPVRQITCGTWKDGVPHGWATVVDDFGHCFKFTFDNGDVTSVDIPGTRGYFGSRANSTDLRSLFRTGFQQHNWSGGPDTIRSVLRNFFPIPPLLAVVEAASGVPKSRRLRLSTHKQCIK
eukprot:GHVO01032609.1.p1 GENE.GHVO01032609.1~~GHVO01032609.1.p1  ORF type:complete len:381 (+),score=74.30 GHVO01032609.1:192-1334(+)